MPSKFFKLIAENRRARHDFEIIEVYKAGIVLKGSEVKSVRLGKVNLRDSFARVERGELWLWGVHISPYAKSRIEEANPTRPRKLLLKASEARKLIGKISQKGFSLIPLKIYFDRDWVKVDLAVAKARKRYDKRAAIKEREVKREIEKGLRANKRRKR
jgi:SsrA-binding protein